MGRITKLKPIETIAYNKNGKLRFLFVAVSILIEVGLFVGLLSRLYELFQWINVVTRIISAVLVLGIYAKHKTSSMKMPWIVLILVFPVMGIALYFLVGLAGTTKKMRGRYRKIDEILFNLIPGDENVDDELKEYDCSASLTSQYLKKYSGFPVYKNTDVEYFSNASDGLNAQIEEIKKAEKFIFMEYHAIEDSTAWKMLEDALVERAQNGVEVRVFYDDIGSIFFVGGAFVKKLESYGIKCRVFNPMVPIFNIFLNNRDHRKITVIDGKVGFTGGYNLADEYFNLTHPYGMWKDTGVKITGEAVKNLTVMFLEMWNAVKNNDIDDTNYLKYLPEFEYTAEEKGFVQPYADTPMDDEQVGEEIYISLINRAEKYCYFMTPYLIITDEMTHALSLASKRGVDVRIITPGIPDKKMVYSVTRSFYNGLVRNGVEIYEWTPGFCHAKMCIIDDKMATVGTINLDYRSLYHHFENGCLMYGCKAIGDIKNDFDETFTECRNVTEQYRTGRSRWLRLGQMILRLFAELL